MNMYERVKNMCMEEMQKFVYWVYMNGVTDGKNNLCDTYGNSYHGGAMLRADAEYIEAHMDMA